MPCATLEADAISIVLLGDFNPAMFHPRWLARFALIRDEEADAAGVSIVSKEFTAFRAEWLAVRVTKDRLEVSTPTESMQPLRDLAIGVLTLLEHTPVRAVGINRQMTYRYSDVAAWHRLGDTLAPKNAWSGFLGSPGMRRLTMEGQRAESPAKYIRITIASPENSLLGLLVGTNEHFEIEGDNPTETAGQLLRLHCEDAHAYAERAVQALMDSAGRQGTA